VKAHGAVADDRPVVVFDLDGPLLDISERYYVAYADLVRNHGLSPMSKALYWKRKRRGVSEGAIFRLSGGRKGVERYLRRRLAHIETRDALLRDRMWPQVPAILRLLKRECVLILVTFRRRPRALTSQLQRLGIHGSFHRVISVPAVARSRGPAKARRVRAALEALPGHGWFVGDTPTDLQAARILGFRAVAVAFGIREAATLRRYAPDAVLRTPRDLLRWARTCLRLGRGEGRRHGDARRLSDGNRTDAAHRRRPPIRGARAAPGRPAA
jgi:phosphoglycolate phosphatase-like HAD superfamily hydrolase